MTGRIVFRIEGYEEAVKKIAAIDPKMEKKIIRKAMRPPAKMVLKDLKAGAPVKSGNLKASLKVRAAKRSRKNKNKIVLLVNTAEKEFTGKAFYSAFLEYGTKKMKPTRWMKNITEPNKEKYSTALAESLIAATNETIEELTRGNLS